jgi:hypothetical protein
MRRQQTPCFLTEHVDGDQRTLALEATVHLSHEWCDSIWHVAAHANPHSMMRTNMDLTS